MSGIKSRMSWLLVVAVLATLLMAAPALAQDASGGPTTFLGRFLNTQSFVGNLIIYICLAMSVAVLAMIIQYALANRASTYMPGDFVETLDQLLMEKKYRDAIDLSNSDKSPFAQMMSAALTQASRGYTAMETALEETADMIGNRRVRGLIWQEIAGAAGPMLGLFGTVFGMILAFFELVGTSGQPKPAELAAGIGTSLITTFWGLIVGIPGVIGAALFRVRIDGLVAESLGRGKEMLAQFRPGGAPKRPSNPAPPPAASSSDSTTKGAPSPA